MTTTRSIASRVKQLDQSPARLYGTSLVSPTPEVVAFMAGWDVATKGAADQALVPFDLWVNRAHTRMLVAQAILTPAQGQAILQGLGELEQRYRAGQFVVRPALEDVHTNIEKFLTDDLGLEAGLAMHTARSRNDQIVTDMRLWMRARVVNLARLCLGLLQALDGSGPAACRQCHGWLYAPPACHDFHLWPSPGGLCRSHTARRATPALLVRHV